MKSSTVSNKKQISYDEFLSYVTKDKRILSILNYYGLITEDDLREDFNGATEEKQLPDCDSDLEDEVKLEHYSSNENKIQLKKPLLQAALRQAPKNFKPSKTDEEPPDATLELEFVYGYKSCNVRNNLRYTRTGRIVYHTASVGIVYNPQETKQQYFFEHKNNISCLAIHPNLIFVATGEISESPYIFIWDTTTMECLTCLYGVLKKGICHLAFSEGGKYLAAIGADYFHSIAIYNWEAYKNNEEGLIASGQVSSTSLLSLVFNPKGNIIAAPGIQEVNFISYTNNIIQVHKGIGWGFNKKQTMLCGVYLDDDFITGSFSGEIVIWADGRLTKITEAHKGMVYAICRREAGRGIITGGSDGIVIVWNSELIKDVVINIADNKALNCYVPKVRSVCEGAEGNILVGVRSGEIIEINQNKVRVLLRSHYKGELKGLAIHPKQPKFITFGEDGVLFDWSINAKRACRVLLMFIVVC